MGYAFYDAVFVGMSEVNQVLKSPTYAWIALVVITFAIWLVFSLTIEYLMIVAVLLSAVKVAVIGFSFMEVNRAKRPVLIFYLAWLTAVAVLFIASELIR